MQINQILVRPSEGVYIIQFSDSAGHSNNVVVNSAGNANVAGLIADAQQQLPAAEDHPDKAAIELEIDALEDRVKLLKESIGLPDS